MASGLLNRFNNLFKIIWICSHLHHKWQQWKKASVWVSLSDVDLGVQVVLPLQYGIKCGGPGHVKHHQRSYRLPVIHTSHVPIPLLSWDTLTAIRHAHTHTHTHIHVKIILWNQINSQHGSLVTHRGSVSFFCVCMCVCVYCTVAAIMWSIWWAWDHLTRSQAQDPHSSSRLQMTGRDPGMRAQWTHTHIFAGRSHHTLLCI